MQNLAEARTSVGARRSDATEAAVLSAFADLVKEAGFAAVTMEAVAKRARAGKATLYRWWPTKAHLALALITKAGRTRNWRRRCRRNGGSAGHG